MNQFKAMTRLLSMGDWLQMKTDINTKKLLNEIESFKNDWKPYNARKPNNRFGLSITSLDGELSGIPDLDSLHEYNNKHTANITNRDINKYTSVYDNSLELQKIIQPWKPWLGRCHFLRLDKGGYFPEHYDIEKLDYAHDEIRLVGFVNKNSKDTMKFIYEDTVINVREGSLYYFNANKRHSVFSMSDDCIMLVFCLKFNEKLFETIINEIRLA
jgi:hypothetical protein